MICFRRAFLFLAMVPLLVMACDHAESPVDLEVAEPPPAFSIVDGSSPDGLDGFFFRPPIVPGTPAGGGEFDPSPLDLLAVEICEWTGSACVLPLVRRLTSEDRLPGRLRIVDSFYKAVWSTARDNLNPAKTYRIRVLASGTELGHADVDILDVGEDGTDPHHSHMVQLVNGDALPIAFRIEKGLGERVGSDATTITLADRQVSLDIPAGALSDDVFITAAPATDLPPDRPPVVPGTAWDFGPDGLVFDQAVTMTISYDPANLPPGTDESELRIHKFVNGTFVQADAGVVDLVNHEVSAVVDGFSVFVVLQRLFPGSPEDLVGPVVLSVEVLDPSTGVFGRSASIDVGSADAVLKTRVRSTDNISGVDVIQIDYRSPSGRQLRRPCWPSSQLISGSDTNGEWECTSLWPRYSEAGLWEPTLVFVNDQVGNFTFFTSGADGLCEIPDRTNCLTGMPEITVVSVPTDVSPPVLRSLDVSLDIQPRSFGTSVTVDAGAQAQPIVFRFHATDDLSGVGSPLERFIVVLGGPNGQRLQQRSCPLTEGTPLDGFWECAFTIPQFAEAGTWGVTRLFVPDRVGNDGIQESASFYTPDGSGRLCQPDGDCVAAPTVEVTSLGDTEPPVLRSLDLNVVGPTVTITLQATDNLSGTNEVVVQFDHATTSQSELCFGDLTAGTSNDGTWQCSISFPEFSARGEWLLSFLTLVDRSSNRRLHRGNVDEDGILCYTTPAGETCEDFGDTVIIVR